MIDLTDMTNSTLRSWGQQITYKPVGAATREMVAIIEYQGNNTLGTGTGRGPEITVTVANDSSSGIVPAEIKCGQDKINLPLKDGSTQDRLIQKIVQADSGMITLEVR